MYTVRTLDGSHDDLIDPTFRKIRFDDAGAVLLVSTHLRYAWKAAPGDSPDVGRFIQANHPRTEEERKQVPQADTTELHTPFRDSIYEHWNHVFYDVMNFFSEVGATGVHFHPPSHDVFAVTHDESEKVWDTDVLLIPAHLEEGVSVRMSGCADAGREEVNRMLGVFDPSNSSEIWYLKRGTKVYFHVEGHSIQERAGIAAVMVVAILCRNHHGEATKEDREGVEEESHVV